MPENEPFIRLGDDGENAPELRYSVPESTDYVGTSIISVDIDPALLNDATRDRLRDNLREKDETRPVTPINNLRLRGVEPTPRSPTMASLATRAEVRTVFADSPSSFILQPQEGLLGFGNFDVITPRPRPDEEIRPKILFFERMKISTFRVFRFLCGWRPEAG